ncbi:MAG: bifunctional metallophosphatase/5'-nucleotidase [Alphaproteobacteria bacterium]|nr:bifunctional metallophosphatase/5'-nucleotidase [Alphaproteobacteria bacterium]
MSAQHIPSPPGTRRSLLLGGALALACSSCDTMVPTAVESDAPALVGQDVRLTILHTSDIHSRLLPYDFDPSFTDNQLGLADGLGSYGGMARIGYILRRERERSGRVLHVDSGDCFQGAIIFNEFFGEAEMRLMTEVGLDAAVIGNHEFDAGAANLARQYSAFGGFDLLAANYDFEDADLPWATGLEDMALPSAIYDLDGLRVGVIGMANLSSLNSIYDQSNSLGVRVIEREQAIPDEAAKLKAQGADIIVVVSHMGLDDDQEMAREFEDIDIIMGGHHHVAIDPPLVVVNEHTGKRIPVVHSGAFAKFVGRFDAIIRDGEVLSFDYQLFPVDAGVPEDPSILDIVEEYQQALTEAYNTQQVLGYACPEEENCEKLTRYGTSGGDSMLGNFTAEAMRSFPGIETEIALTNTLGIRSDINAGEITLDDIYNAMPFDNTIATMYLSGDEIQELLGLRRDPLDRARVQQPGPGRRHRVRHGLRARRPAGREHRHQRRPARLRRRLRDGDQQLHRQRRLGLLDARAQLDEDLHGHRDPRRRHRRDRQVPDHPAGRRRRRHRGRSHQHGVLRCAARSPL